MSRDQALEDEIRALNLTAPRVSADDVSANVTDVEIVKHVSRSGQVLRWAVLTTRNGFAVVGKPSCSVSAENDRAEIGEKVAIENSRSELWAFMGYALKDRVHRDAMVNNLRELLNGDRHPMHAGIQPDRSLD